MNILDLTKFIVKSRKVFIWDAVGALVSACLMGIVLPRFQTLFGIPLPALYFLAALPCAFVLYDLCAYQFGRNKSGQLLKGIAALNLIYAVISISLAIYHRASLTSLGWLYLVGEVLVLIVLAKFEYELGNKWQENN